MCKSRRHRQVEVDHPVSEEESPHPSGRSRISKPSLRARTAENIHISGESRSRKRRNRSRGKKNPGGFFIVSRLQIHSAGYKGKGQISVCSGSTTTPNMHLTDPTPHLQKLRNQLKFFFPPTTDILNEEKQKNSHLCSIFPPKQTKDKCQPSGFKDFTQEFHAEGIQIQLRVFGSTLLAK